MPDGSGAIQALVIGTYSPENSMTLVRRADEPPGTGISLKSSKVPPHQNLEPSQFTLQTTQNYIPINIIIIINII